MTPQMQISSSMISALNHWQGTEPDEDDAEDSGYDRDEDTEDERPMLNHIRDNLNTFTREEELRQIDSKFELMYQTLTQYLEEQPEAKIVIFAYFKSTLRYLEGKFREKNKYRTIDGRTARAKGNNYRKI